MAITINWDQHLLVLSVVAAAIGSYAALDMASRVQSSQDRNGLLWLVGGAITLGFTIYSSNFIGISSLRLGMPVLYHSWFNILSIIIAILGSGVAFVSVTRKHRDKLHLLCGSVAFGLAIALTHYTAIISMHMAAKIVYNPLFFALSIAASILFSAGVLWLAFWIKPNKQNTWFLQKIGSAVLMGVTISIVHHSSISAASFFSLKTATPSVYTATVGNIYLKDVLILINVLWGLMLIFLGTQTSWERETALEAIQLSQQRGFNNEQRLLDTFEKAAVGIAQISPEGKWLRLNPKYCEILGYTHAELMNLTFQEVTHPDELEENIIINTQLLTGKIDNYAMEKRYIRKDGSLVWVNVMVSLVRDEQQRPLYSIAVVEDITERKRTEEALEMSRKREHFAAEIIDDIRAEIELDLILHNAVEGIGQLAKADRCLIWLYDAELQRFEIPDANREYCRNSNIVPVSSFIHYLPGIEFSVVSDTFILPYALGYTQRANIPDIFKMENLTEADYRVIREQEIKSLLHVPILYNGQFLGAIRVHSVLKKREWDEETVSLVERVAARLAVAIYHAKTVQELKKSETELKVYASKLEQSNKDLEHFATIASHDLQAPLRKVLMFSTYLQESATSKLTAEEWNYIERMQKSIFRMQSLINDLLDLSRVNRKGKPFTNTDLQALTKEILLDLQQLMNENDGRVEIGEMVSAAVDATQMQSLLFNLIENGLKFHRKNVPPIVKISAFPIDERYYEIVVSDNGIGIRTEHLSKIFEIFSRLHGADRYPGTGVGLALCKKIAERHGGIISINSQEGVGSTFRVKLPFQPSGVVAFEEAR